MRHCARGDHDHTSPEDPVTLEYLLTSLIVVLLPGTGVLYTLAYGLGQGFRAGALAAFGCTLGILPHILASVVGLAALLHASALAFQIVKYIGVAYLLYMAWTMLRAGGAISLGPERAAVSVRRIVISGMLVNILNPKLTIFFLAFLPQFIPAEAVQPTALMLFLAAIFMALTFAVFLVYGALAAMVRDQVISRPAVMRWLHRGFAAAFVGMGARLVLSER